MWSKRLTLLACVLSMMAGVSMAQACGDALATHNMYRARHGTEGLQWDDGLVAEAQAKATELANAGCRSLSADIMQNVWACLGKGCGSCSVATDTWYKGGVDMFKFTEKPWTDNKANFYKGVGGFTQVVWRSAKSLGCALARGPDGCGVIVCQYDAGNMIGDASFKANVLPLKSSDNTNSNGSGSGDGTVVVAPSPVPSPVAPDTKPPASCGDALSVHNKYRGQHGAAGLKWDNKLAGTSQTKAKALAAKGCRALSADVGQNVWACFGKGCGSCSAATDAWYKGGATAYKFTAKPYTNNKAQFNKIGGFTQLVWKGAKSVGCSQAAGNGCSVVVCTYDAGNLSTDKAFKDNVLRKGTKVSPATPAVKPGANEDKLPWCADWAKEGKCEWLYDNAPVFKACPKSCPQAPLQPHWLLAA